MPRRLLKLSIGRHALRSDQRTRPPLDLQALHRVRIVSSHDERPVINQLRAFLLEHGMTFAKTPAKLKVAMPETSRTLTRT